MLAKENRSYCSGLYEGEGTIHTQLQVAGLRYGTNRSATRQITLSIAMTDREPLDIFEDLIGYGNVYGPYQYKGNRKSVYIYRAATFEKVQFIVCNMWEWLSPRRKKQIEIAFKRYTSFKNLDMVVEGEK